MNARNADGDTALHLAALHGYRDPAPVLLLLDAAADANARNTKGETALHRVVWNAGDAIIEGLLVRAGVDVNARNSEGETALHLAALDGYANSARRLLEAGADAEVRDAEDNTAAMLATKGNHADVARVLREAGVTVEKTVSERIEELSNMEASRERFQLFNACSPTDILVTLNQREDEVVQGLSEENIKAAVESSLRVARLFDAEASSYLSVYVQLMGATVGDRRVGWTYTTRVKFNKLVRDVASGQARHASTWEKAVSGLGPTGPGIGESILGDIRGYMDQFLTEYLRVNEEACE